MIDDHISAQLTASRLRWLERPTSAEWHEWLSRTAKLAYRGRAPELSSIRIHSLPGWNWEVLLDGNGKHCLVADDELTATLAELRLLSLPASAIDAGYDKSILMLADSFRTVGDLDRYAVCLGWALPRRERIRALRIKAINQQSSSAETMVVMLHEIAHRVLDSGMARSVEFKDLCRARVDKTIEALTEGALHDKALADGIKLGLSVSQMRGQLLTYRHHLQGNEALLTELSCDFLAVLAFLNLKSAVDVFLDLESGPSGMSTKDVGDALYVAHGAIQNMQSLVAVQSIAAAVRNGPHTPGVAPDRTSAELSARSTVLVSLITNLLQAWVEDGHLRTEWPSSSPNAGDALILAISKRNRIRTKYLLDPLQDLDAVFHDLDRYADFKRDGLANLRRAGLVWPGTIKSIDATRWEMTTC